jgi:putative transcriptional regulator
MKNRLKVLRAERDWTQADLADRLEVSRQTINAIEKGKFDPSLPLAFKAARLFGMANHGRYFLDWERRLPILRRACKCAFPYALRFDVSSEASSEVARPVFHK